LTPIRYRSIRNVGLWEYVAPGKLEHRFQAPAVFPWCCDEISIVLIDPPIARPSQSNAMLPRRIAKLQQPGPPYVALLPMHTQQRPALEVVIQEPEPCRRSSHAMKVSVKLGE
jgi:hypothetical protein